MDDEAPRLPIWLNLGLVLIALSTWLAYTTCAQAEAGQVGTPAAAKAR